MNKKYFVGGSVFNVSVSKNICFA